MAGERQAGLALVDRDAAQEALGALPHPTRFAAAKLLAAHGTERLPAGKVARWLGVPRNASNALSIHPGIPARAGLLRSARASRIATHRLDLARIDQATAFLRQALSPHAVRPGKPQPPAVRLPCRVTFGYRRGNEKDEYDPRARGEADAAG